MDPYFEQRSAARAFKARCLREYNRLKALQSANLKRRKQQLRDLLVAEEEMYRQEFIALQPTIEDKVSGMKQKLSEIRERKKDEHQKYAKQQRERAWRTGCDEVREYDTRLENRLVKDAIQLQIEEKKMLAEYQKREDDYFVQQDAQDVAKKLKREKDEKARRTTMNQTFRLGLDSQMAVRDSTLQRERKQRLEDNKAFTRRAEDRIKQEKDEYLAQRAHDREHAALLTEFTAIKSKRDQRMRDEERRQDEEFAAQCAADAKAAYDADQDRRSQHARYMCDYMEYQKQLKDQEKQQEKEVEKYFLQDQARLTAAAEAKDRAAEEKRRVLAKQCYSTCDELIASRQKAMDDIENDIREEGIRAHRDRQRYFDDEARKEKAKRLAAKEDQKLLLAQAAAKRQAIADEKQKLKDEEKAMLEAQAAETRRIKSEVAATEQQLRGRGGSRQFKRTMAEWYY
ncbi:putative multi-domain containing protein [Aduncisulcus paluster]|uniref:Multi-domain containing protein n=1 Tax=Aduncisulcus paluster TaxID=2918883 RepID=A0ABQ5KPF0_9EUKA|nr:putative multi-domain containing protein [Aduncisulcus paluster]